MNLAKLSLVSLLVLKGLHAQAPEAVVFREEAPRLIADFELEDQHGRRFPFSKLRGQPVLIFFGFTHCPTICPAAMSKLSILTRESEAPGKFATVFISVDGERDTPAVVKQYLASFAPSFIGLTGAPEMVKPIAADFGAVFRKPRSQEGLANYQVGHTAMIHLVDAEGRLRTTFADSAPVKTIQGALSWLLFEEEGR
jgi:protein SCO1/2